MTLQLLNKMRKIYKIARISKIYLNLNKKVEKRKENRLSNNNKRNYRRNFKWPFSEAWSIYNGEDILVFIYKNI